MTRLILVRHGHVDGIDPERFRGRTELPLTPLGIAQAKSLAQHIAANWQPAAIYTSPMGRCLSTAKPIADACSGTVEALSDLNDLHYGNWQWRSYAEVRRDCPKLFQAWMKTPAAVRFPNGDSLQDLVARTANAVRVVLERHPDDTVVAVGHDSVNRAILLQALDMPLSAYWRIGQSPCCTNEIEYSGGAIRVLRMNEIGYLNEVLLS